MKSVLLLALVGVTLPVWANNAEQRAQMVIRMRAAVNEISKEYGDESPFAFVFTNDPKVSRVMRHNASAIEQLVPIEELVDSRMEDVSELDGKIAGLEGQLISLAQKRESLSSESAQLESKVIAMESDMARMRTTVTSLQLEKDRLNNQINSRRLEITQLNQSFRTQQENYSFLVAEYNQLRNHYVGAKAEIAVVFEAFRSIQEVAGQIEVPTIRPIDFAEPVTVPTAPIESTIEIHDDRDDLQIISLIASDSGHNTAPQSEVAPVAAEVAAASTVSQPDDKPIVADWWEEYSSK